MIVEPEDIRVDYVAQKLCEICQHRAVSNPPTLNRELMKRTLAGILAGLLLASCGSQRASAPVTSTVIQTAPAVTTVKTVQTTLERTMTESVTEMSTVTETSASGRSLYDVCKDLSDSYGLLSTEYLENYEQDVATFTGSDYRGLGKAIRISAATITLFAEQLDNPTVKRAWAKASSSGKAAAEQYIAGNVDNGAKDLATFIEDQTAALKACTAAL